MLKYSYSEKLLFKKIKELFVVACKKEKGIKIPNPDNLELVDRNSESEESEEAEKPNDEVSSFFEKTTSTLKLNPEGMSTAFKIFENVNKKEEEQKKMSQSLVPNKPFEGLIKKTRKNKSRDKVKNMIKLDYSVHRVIYAKTEPLAFTSFVDESYTIKRMRSDVDMDSSANNLSFINVD